MQVRKLDPHDLPALAHATRDAAPLADADLPPLLAGGGRLLVAEEGAGNAVGFVHFVAGDGGTQIRRVTVDPDYRRAGVGTALVKKVLKGAARAGAGVTALVHEEDADALEFYKEGFGASSRHVRGAFGDRDGVEFTLPTS
jgi:ribosomal protein S18 acetylase RimI-like enzyme